MTWYWIQAQILVLEQGASMVKWTKKGFWLTKTINLLVKGIKIVAKRCLNWIFSYDNLYYWFNTQIYNIKLRFLILNIKINPQKQMVEYSVGHRFHDINYYEVEIPSHIPWVHCILQSIITQLCREPSIYCNFILFKQKCRHSLVQYHLLAHHCTFF